METLVNSPTKAFSNKEYDDEEDKEVEESPFLPIVVYNFLAVVMLCHFLLMQKSQSRPKKNEAIHIAT